MRMSFRLAFSLFPVLCAVAVCHSEERHQAPKSPPLACTIRSEPTCELGKAPSIKVEIANWTDDEVYLVGSLDASDCKWRYPLCYFEIIGPDGKSPVRNIARCGDMNSIREKDFVKVPRGGKFDPYQHVDEYGFFGSSQITPATFQFEGEYRIRFVYSTDKSDPKFWLGDAKGDKSEILNSGGADNNVVKLLAKVPKTTISSNEITVKIVRPKK
jgi:hypothetical protein